MFKSHSFKYRGSKNKGFGFVLEITIIDEQDLWLSWKNTEISNQMQKNNLPMVYKKKFPQLFFCEK